MVCLTWCPFVCMSKKDIPPMPTKLMLIISNSDALCAIADVLIEHFNTHHEVKQCWKTQNGAVVSRIYVSSSFVIGHIATHPLMIFGHNLHAPLWFSFFLFNFLFSPIHVTHPSIHPQNTLNLCKSLLYIQHI